MRKLIFGMLLLIQSVSFAGGVGNGGFTIKCETGFGKATFVYDYVDGKRRYDNVTRLEHLTRPAYSLRMGQGPKALDYVEYVLTRLERVDGTRANLYRSWAKDFLAESEEASSLAEFSDIGIGIIPKVCDQPLVVIGQRDPNQIFDGDLRYARIPNRWDPLAEQVKGGIILHELIYREALLYPHLTSTSLSTSVRYLNSVISSNWLDGLDQQAYEKVLKEIQFPIFSFRGASVFFHGAAVDWGKEIKRLDDGTMSEGTFAKGAKMDLLGQSVRVTGNFSTYKIPGYESFSVSLLDALVIHSELGDVLCKDRLIFFPDRVSCFRNLNSNNTYSGSSILIYGDTKVDVNWIDIGKDGKVLSLLQNSEMVFPVNILGVIVNSEKWMNSASMNKTTSYFFKTPVILPIFNTKLLVNHIWLSEGTLNSAWLATPQTFAGISGVQYLQIQDDGVAVSTHNDIDRGTNGASLFNDKCTLLTRDLTTVIKTEGVTCSPTPLF